MRNNQKPIQYEIDGDASCAKCNCPIRLSDGCEWPDDGSKLLCWECQHAELIRLRRLLKAKRKP